MIRILGTVLAGLLGLAFGSFLNVCLSRWPEGESIVTPRSHCRNCSRTLTWWENIPLVSWLALRGRCRTCKTKISWRYPLVELSVGVTWACVAWNTFDSQLIFFTNLVLVRVVGQCVLIWLLVALAVLDAEHLWLPDKLTWPGIFLGLLSSAMQLLLVERFFTADHGLLYAIGMLLGSAALAALLILAIRWTYWLVRRREGIGLGDAKLMAMLGAWLGLSGALLSFAIGVVLGAIFALVALAVPAARRESNTWLAAKLPLGTFLCVGGIISALWGRPIVAAYMRWAGL
ncbi:MAG TPA: prepilin peptidase [Terracidiphilus sp.]|nr:prepilin peptidase [Terracidiphilus sp.]